MTTVDVNQAFAAERTATLQSIADEKAAFDQRIADGKLIPLGNGQFRVNDPTSWDNGEVWTQAQGRALPQHGLDTTLGREALFTRVPAWHSLGHVAEPGRHYTLTEILDAAGLNFTVEKRKVRYQVDGELFELPDHFVNTRSDTNAGLGVVGRIYTPIQNLDGAGFVQNLVDDFEIPIESAGATRGGRRVFVSLRLPQTVTIDAAGIDDEIQMFLAAINSHDGSSPFYAVLSPWRPVCGNTERFALRDAVTRWTVRHTRNAMDRIAEARRSLGLATKYADAFAAEENMLAQTRIRISTLDKVIDDLWPVKDDPSKRAVTYADNRKATIRGMFTAQGLGSTAYAAERAITDYLDHVAPARPSKTMTEEIARATKLIEGSDDELKSRAHKRLMALTTR